MARNGKLLLGAVLGALFGLAFAPKKGSELRKDLKTEIEKGGHGEATAKKTAAAISQDVAVTAKEVYNDPTVQKQLDKGKKEAQKFVDQAKGRLQESSEEWVKMAKEKIVEGKKNLEKEGAKAFDTLKKKVILDTASVKKTITAAGSSKNNQKTKKAK